MRGILTERRRGHARPRFLTTKKLRSTLPKFGGEALAWHEVPGAQALGEDEAMATTLDGRPVALVRSGGRFYALHNVCTHQYALLSDGYVEDGCIECPLHQGRFELSSGAPKGAPVTEPVRVYPVRNEDGKVYVDIHD